jgi:hypothetical protein
MLSSLARDADYGPGIQHRDPRQGSRCYSQRYVERKAMDVLMLIYITVDKAVEYILAQPDGRFY